MPAREVILGFLLEDQLGQQPQHIHREGVPGVVDPDLARHDDVDLVLLAQSQTTQMRGIEYLLPALPGRHSSAAADEQRHRLQSVVTLDDGATALVGVHALDSEGATAAIERPAHLHPPQVNVIDDEQFLAASPQGILRSPYLRRALGAPVHVQLLQRRMLDHRYAGQPVLRDRLQLNLRWGSVPSRWPDLDVQQAAELLQPHARCDRQFWAHAVAQGRPPGERVVDAPVGQVATQPDLFEEVPLPPGQMPYVELSGGAPGQYIPAVATAEVGTLVDQLRFFGPLVEVVDQGSAALPRRWRVRRIAVLGAVLAIRQEVFFDYRQQIDWRVEFVFQEVGQVEGVARVVLQRLRFERLGHLEEERDQRLRRAHLRVEEEGSALLQRPLARHVGECVQIDAWERLVEATHLAA
ncbi:hypothetical protein [Streptomyces sp. NBC_00847]|uniref:hypothetical protein n=1 Tax=unclassified Streptomyces TaxID=2593676 RepID=UPI002251D311|nr:hypothetical protein [Streptomyces sp. NBC_00847]MCX4881400.1 hypothetical protein [Streptomyces sp. NBC_00847]